ncbi:MAG: ABC transporter ATP-binding protein [Chitinophagaceae bacterium]|nr:ABC transporter ATP-binding protein [Chitinophagaceae bacterium]
MSDQAGIKKIFDFSLLRRVFQYASPYKRKFYISVALAIILAVISPVRPMLIQYTINDAIQNGLVQLLVTVTIIQVILLIAETALRFYFTFLTAWLGQTVVKDLRVKVYKKVLSLNLSQFDKTPIGTLTTRTINDIEAINDIFSEGLIPIIADFLSIIAVLIAMFWMNWQLTLICLIPFPFLIIATYYFKESVNKSFIRVRNAVAQLNAFVQEHITGMQVVQAFAAEEREMEKFKKINREHRNANIRAIFAYSVFFPVVEIVLAVSMGLLVWFAATQVLHLPAEKALQLTSQIIAFIIMLNLLFRPLRVIADKFNVLQMGMVASERVFRVMDNPDYTQPGGSHAPQKIKGEIEFKNVWFAYNDDKFVLKDISFHVKPGETVAIVGHTGSGKTSIISLLNRQYEIQKGEIKIDGINISAYQLERLRSAIGVVLQDVFLFSGSIYDNVTLRNTAISKQEVEQAARLIGMHDFIMQLPGGYDYNVMERGSTLSLGQRQLLSFIRALLYNPSILILDEATSSVDTESEQLIQHAIDTLIAGRTSVVIAHRLSTIRKANKIIVLDRGEIKEAGTHEELLQKGGFYAKLHEMQFVKHKPVKAL